MTNDGVSMQLQRMHVPSSGMMLWEDDQADNLLNRPVQALRTLIQLIIFYW